MAYENRRRRRGFRRFNGPRQMHKITCSDCGKEGEVPFKPREGTPVYCKDCFMKRKGITPKEVEKSQESNEEETEEDDEDLEEIEEESEEFE